MQNLKKYDGKQDPRQWLRIYSTAIEAAGGTNSTKVINSWDDLKQLFINNFQGSIHQPATRHDLRLCKQSVEKP